MEVHQLTTSGLAFSALIQEAAQLRGSFDGFLIGESRIRTESIVHDIQEDTKRELLEVHITTFCCCSGLGSFYNAAGDIEAEEVTGIIQSFSGHFLGWFVHHCGPHRQPTLRERTVTAALAQLVPPHMPVLLALMTSAVENDKATVGFEQHFLEQEPGTVVLRPVELRVENLGSLKRLRDYKPLRPVSTLCLASRTINGPDSLTVETAGKSIEQAYNTQTENLENIFESMIERLQEAAQLAVSEQRDLRSLQYEVTALAMSKGS